MHTQPETIAKYLGFSILVDTIATIRAWLRYENQQKGESNVSRDNWEVLFTTLDSYYAELSRRTSTPEIFIPND